MGPKSAWSASFAGDLLGAIVLLAAAMPAPAHAQHADAGVQEKAATPPPAAEPPAAEPPPGHEPSGVLPKAINPAQLSESARARFAERAAGRHATSLPVREPAPRHVLPPETAPGATTVPPYRPRNVGSEPLRRGQAHMRVQAVETDEGVTLLSNRIQLPEPRLSEAVAKRPLPAPERPLVEEAATAAGPPRTTETHSLRPMSSSSKKAKNSGGGLDWLLWPFVLFVTTGAVVGTLWFRKKTE